MQESPQPPPLPVRLERYHEAPPRPGQKRRFWLNPASGLLILGVDWLFFVPEAATLGIAIPAACVLAFAITFCGVYWIQRKKAGDALSPALMKALLAGIVAGVPTSIGGTMLGTLVLVMSGLRPANPLQQNPVRRA
jgi:hypothetical protein